MERGGHYIIITFVQGTVEVDMYTEDHKLFVSDFYTEHCDIYYEELLEYGFKERYIKKIMEENRNSDTLKTITLYIPKRKAVNIEIKKMLGRDYAD